ncbi:kinase-like protein [Setomelanomma holmii]|uniref:Kinase-like protein n=1 Tax=Setomelanomma holmii TaxID=210430 RepID=A0A9P4GZC6_9PLEO|nr:kinase-like protein [Setomelanomma holmii]
MFNQILGREVQGSQQGAISYAEIHRISAAYVFVNTADHLELESLGLTIEDLPYRYMKMLGRRGTASVEIVADIKIGSVYARKIVRYVYTRNMREARIQLENEVRIMRKLEAHHHIVAVHAKYIAKRELAIILNPAADGGDLASYLQDLHDVLYAEFGLSFDFGDCGRSTTVGPVQGLTRRYCATEVAAGARRNRKSDVFSLGCVYFEIINGLYPASVNEDLLRGPFQERYPELQASDEVWQCRAELWQPEMSEIEDLQMLNADPKQRPSAEDVTEGWIEYFGASVKYQRYFCLHCSGSIRV